MATPTPEELVAYLRTENQFEESLRAVLYEEVEWAADQATEDDVFSSRPTDEVVQEASLALAESALSPEE